jgi:2-dehydro-3-deoxyphosphogluconate aldolase/(4S)-4-hydroxy-2-oxoglutarate aldolase
MEKRDALERLKKAGLAAVIRGPSADLTVQMVSALVAGGVEVIEITFGTPHAEDLVATLSRERGTEILVGMGTVTDPVQAMSAQAAGASFLVSPICDSELVRAMSATGLLTMAGALTPTEVQLAYRLGSDVVKLFPGSLAGPAYVKALWGPFPYIPIMPTGGVNLANIGDWFSSGVVAVGAGSELCPWQLAREGRFQEITARAAEFVAVVRAALEKTS